MPKKPNKVRDNIEAINKGKKKKDTKRIDQASKIKKSLLKKYDTLRHHRNGLAVVNVVDGVCQGCFMALPPQRYNMLLKGDEIFDCPTCQRLNYYVPPEQKKIKAFNIFALTCYEFPTTLANGAGAWSLRSFDRRGKSELYRAGWFVTRTPGDRGKVPQKTNRLILSGKGETAR